MVRQISIPDIGRFRAALEEKTMSFKSTSRSADERATSLVMNEAVAELPRYDCDAIERRIARCGRLPSLHSINSALKELLAGDDNFGAEVPELIRRDPSLTARLLRLVNSVYFGLPSRVDRIEEAVLYLGVRQIRQLALVTPVIADFQKLSGDTPFRWRQFWRHCLGAALIATDLAGHDDENDELEYVCGLVHDVGKIVMAAEFPDHFVEIHRAAANGQGSLIELERGILGMDHAELGGRYLVRQQLHESIVQATRHHHAPEAAGEHAGVAAIVSLADLCIRSAGMGFSGNVEEVPPDAWRESPCWDLLPVDDRKRAMAQVAERLGRLNAVLDCAV